MKAIRATGTLEDGRRVIVDQPLPVTAPTQVRVFISVAEEGDTEEISEEEWLRAMATNPVFDYLKAPEEDIYTINDGKPFHDPEFEDGDPAEPAPDESVKGGKHLNE